jgi:hypothetical protein
MLFLDFITNGTFNLFLSLIAQKVSLNLPNLTLVA